MLKRILALMLSVVLCGAVMIAATPSAEAEMPYYIDVDLTNQITTVYRTSDGAIVRQMICSSGINDSTPEGKWRMIEKGRVSERTPWTYLEQYRVFVKYATRVHLGYMFHSLPYFHREDTEPDPQAEAELGTPTSHGCIRLRWEDAYFIAMNCQVGTLVNFHKDNAPNEELRALLKESSYTDEDGLTYNEFLGYSADALSRGSAGDNVLDLKHRLADLGYYEGEISPIYDTQTMAAVKAAQADLGLAQTGVTTDDLQQILFSDEAPVSSGNTTLKIGSSGPIVRKLQTALAQLGLYKGEPNSIFDPELENAVKLFQGVCGFVADGVATPLLQQILYYELDRIRENCGEDFVAKVNMEEIIMARVEAEVKIIVRSKPNTESDEVGKVKNGDAVIVNGTNDEWAQILVGTTQGYIKKKYLNAYKQQNTTIELSGSSGTYSMGHSMKDYMAGEESLAQKYAGGVPKEKKKAEDIPQTITVNTGSDDISMNLRGGPGSDHEVIGEVPNGTTLEIIGSEEGWTKVNYNAVEGYLMNDYLTFNGSAFDGNGDIDLEDVIDEEITAIVISAGGANLYKTPSADAEKVKSVKAGTEMKVLEMAGDDFVKVQFEKRGAYMRNVDLQFQLT